MGMLFVGLFTFQDQKLSRQSGNSGTEYGLLGALIACVVISSLSVLGQTVSHLYSDVLDNAPVNIAKQPAVISQTPQVAHHTSPPTDQVSTLLPTGSTNSNKTAGGTAADTSSGITQTAGANGDLNQVNSNSGSTNPSTQTTKQTGVSPDTPEVIELVDDPQYFIQTKNGTVLVK